MRGFPIFNYLTYKEKKSSYIFRQANYHLFNVLFSFRFYSRTLTLKQKQSTILYQTLCSWKWKGYLSLISMRKELYCWNNINDLLDAGEIVAKQFQWFFLSWMNEFKRIQNFGSTFVVILFQHWVGKHQRQLKKGGKHQRV